MEAASNKQAAVLFADIAGSTRLYETLGDAVALTMIGRCLDVIREVCEERDGRVIKTIGDEIMALFASEHRRAATFTVSPNASAWSTSTGPNWKPA